MGIPLSLTFKDPQALTENDLKLASTIFCLYEKEQHSIILEQFLEHTNKINYWDFLDLDEISPDVILGAIQRKVGHLLDINQSKK